MWQKWAKQTRINIVDEHQNFHKYYYNCRLKIKIDGAPVEGILFLLASCISDLAA